MNWEEKTKMVEAASAGNRTEFQGVVLDNIESFDGQAWDMFINVIDLSDPDHDPDFMGVVYSKITSADFDVVHLGLGLVTQIRLNMLRHICKKLMTGTTKDAPQPEE